MHPTRILAAAALAACVPAAQADDNKLTLENRIAQCQGCHGIVGWRTAYPEVYRVPKIAGQHPTYIIAALKEYKSGSRSHPSMKAIASSLSDADMADLAAYYNQTLLRTAEQ